MILQIAVLAETEGKGSFCSMVMAVVVAKDILVFCCFAINLEAATAVSAELSVSAAKFSLSLSLKIIVPQFMIIFCDFDEYQVEFTIEWSIRSLEHLNGSY